MIKKIYLSRAQTRAMAADHPVGDPTGGPAFGEKNDPISAVIAISSMAGTYALAGSFAAMTLMQGITFAGAALSLVGNITGNKTLSKIGMIAGVAGGLGMAYDKVMGTTIGGTVGDAFGMESGVTDEMLKNTPVINGSQTPVVEGVPAATSNAVPLPDIKSTNSNPVDTPNVNAPNVNLPGGATSPLNAPRAKDILGRDLPQMSYAPGFGPNTSSSVLPPAKPGFAEYMKAGKYLDAASAVGSGAMDMLKGNPYGAYVAAQAVGGVADWLSGKTDSEIAALKANTGFADAKAQEVQLAIAKEERRRLNMANRYASVSPQSGIAINPNATGLVASNMQTPPA